MRPHHFFLGVEDPAVAQRREAAAAAKARGNVFTFLNSTIGRVNDGTDQPAAKKSARTTQSAAQSSRAAKTTAAAPSLNMQLVLKHEEVSCGIVRRSRGASHKAMVA